VRLLAVHAAALALAVLAAHAAGCGGSPDDSAQPSCPNVGELSCPSTPPSFKSDVQPIIQDRCYPCHGPGGVEVASVNLTTYASTFALRSDIASQVQSCRMPEVDASALTADQITTILEWIECSAPNN
jgi:uncharacterized membrane protein